ncbi:hypothetical protein Aduo_019705 [Ancylostoma duodenale]
MKQKYKADEDDNPFVHIKKEQIEYSLYAELTDCSRENEHGQEATDDADDNQLEQKFVPENAGRVTPAELTGEEAFAYCYCKGCILAARRGWIRKIELVDLCNEVSHHFSAHDDSDETNQGSDDEDYRTDNEDQNHDLNTPSETTHFDPNYESTPDDFDGGNSSLDVRESIS